MPNASNTHRLHIDLTSTSHRPNIYPTSTPHRPHIDPISTPHRPHIDLTSTLHWPHIKSHQKNINVSKHFILGHLWLNISPVKMLYKHKRDLERDCPVCDKPGLRDMSDHLHQVHHLYDDEKKKWLGRARFSISHKHCSGSLPACPTRSRETGLART